MSRQTFGIMGAVLLLMAIIMGGVLLYLGNRRLSVGSKGAKRAEGTVNSLYLYLYPYLSRSLLTKHGVANIRSRLEISGNTNERSIRKKTIQVLGMVSLVQISLVLVVVLVTKQWLMIAMFLGVLWSLSETFVEFFVIRQKNRLMKQQIKFNDLIRHKYYERGMVDEAIYEACQSLDRHHFEIGLQGQRIHDILMARDIEKEMVAYNETAPNKFLKMLLGLAYMTMEYGDVKVGESSVFMKNLSDLTGEIRIELMKRERLNYALKSLNVIVLVPLFFIAPIRNWASSYFLPLKRFYESRTGFLLEVATVLLIFGCYLLLRRIQQFDDNRHGIRRISFEQKLYEKFLHPIVDMMKPRGRGSYRLKRRLKVSASRLTPEAFVTRQLLAGLLGFIFAVGVVIALHNSQRQLVLTAPTFPESFLGGQLSAEELARAYATTEEDAAYLSQMTGATTKEEILVLISDKELPVEALLVVAERIAKKQTLLFDQYFKWWEWWYVLAFAVAMWHLPKAFIYFQQRILRIELEDEVAGFAAIIMMLMHHQRLSVHEVLEWMEIYANALKEAIGDCINDSAAGLTEALETLRETSDNQRFVGIVDSLILASGDITLAEAFEELTAEKAYYMEERKETNQRIVERKINLGRMVGFTPLYGLIVIYMILPMISASVGDMQQYFQQLSL